jgi:hypothetical protein
VLDGWALAVESEVDGKFRFRPKRAKETRVVVDGHFLSVPQVAGLDSEIELALRRLLSNWSPVAAAAGS